MILGKVVSRRPMGDLVAAYSGASLEQIELADGRLLVLKHLPPEGDWLTRASGGAGRLRVLWESGLLKRARRFADHTIIDLVSTDGTDTVIMRDASNELLPPAGPIGRETSRLLMRGLGALHDEFAGKPDAALCSIGARYAMFAPAFHASDDAPGAHPARKEIVSGWRLFAEHVDAALVDAVFAIHADPGGLEQRLGRFPSTLLHGDAKLENLGLSPDGFLVAIDWGDLTGFGPREVDVAWYALKGSDRIGCTPDEIFADYEAVCGRPLEAEALDLVCIGSLAQMGFRFAASAFEFGDPRAGAQLSWWTERAHAALKRVGPFL